MRLANVQALVNARKPNEKKSLIVGGDWSVFTIGENTVMVSESGTLNIEEVDSLTRGQGAEITLQFRVTADGQVLKRIAALHRL